jgi:iron(III) transport system permease protein
LTPAPDRPRVGDAFNPWLLLSGLAALLVLAPVLALIAAAGGGSPGVWRELVVYVLPAALRDTTILLLGVGVLTAVIGTGTAWLVTAYDFRGRRVVDWALLLPLAVPTYIVAYAYLDILHPVGPVQSAIRALIGVESPRDFRLPDVRSMGGCIVLLGFVLYPYVYLTTRAMFLMQAASLIDTARTLGVTKRAMLTRVALPLARPAVAVGLALALMEALNDIGASEFLGVRTMTVSIYTTWVTRSDLAGAAQIALAMLAGVVVLVWFERWARRQRRYATDAQNPRRMAPQPLRGLRGIAALLACLVPIAIGFVVPSIYLVDAAIGRARFAGVSPTIVSAALNTVTVSLIATLLVLALAVCAVYAVRMGRGAAGGIFARTASLGYAVPGTVLAIGVLPVVTGIEALIDGAARAFGSSSGLLLLGSGAALIYAYQARFLAIGTGNVEAGFSRIPPSIDDAARTMGQGATARLVRIHLPLMKPALATAALLVFVDCMKELPATLLLRPLGFETLATFLYGEAARGTYEDGAIAALLIVAAGLLPVIVLARVGYETAGGDSTEARSLGRLFG